MVPRRRNPTITQTLWRGREHVWVLSRVLFSGPITALAAASRQCKVNIFGRHTSGPLWWMQRGSTRTQRHRKPPCVASMWNHNQPFSVMIVTEGLSETRVPVSDRSPRGPMNINQSELWAFMNNGAWCITSWRRGPLSWRISCSCCALWTPRRFQGSRLCRWP